MLAVADVRTYVAERGLAARAGGRAAGRMIVLLSLYAALATVGFVASRWVVWVAVWFVQSLILVGSYSAMHDTGHGTMFRSRVANRVVGVFWASTILVNWSLYRSFHLEHHAHTAEDDDPEAKYKVDITHRSQYLLMPLGGLQFFGDLWFGSLGTLAGRFPRYVRTRTGRDAIRFDGLVLVAATSGGAFGLLHAPGIAMQIWIAPLVLMWCVTMPGTALNEHYGCATSGNALQTSRTVVSNRFVRFLLWNTNYHAGHHLVPTVTFRHAPELFRYLEPDAGYVASGYVAFHLDVLRNCGRTR